MASDMKNMLVSIHDMKHVSSQSRELVMQHNNLYTKLLNNEETYLCFYVPFSYQEMKTTRKRNNILMTLPEI